MPYSKLIGAVVKRKEDPRLITGTAIYTGDLKLAGLHHVALVRSPYAHARIRSIDAAAALARPGVVAVVTGQDLIPLCDPMPMAGSSEGGSMATEAGGGGKKHTHYPLAVDLVRHVGEPVAAVIAASPAIAADATFDIVVDWEPLPAIVDPLKALEAGAPRVFDDMPNNVEHVWECKAGDPEAAFANAFRVVKQRMVNQRIAGIPLEGRVVAAAHEPTTGELTIWTATQAPHYIRTNLVKALRMPENQIRVIAPEVGGGFGVKGDVNAEEVLLGALALKFGLPLRWVETRVEHMTATTHGRGQIAEVEAAVQEDGTMTALRMRLIADLGAYPRAPVIPELTGQMAVGVYRIPNVDIEVTCVFTNTTPVSAYRGAGRPEGAYYIERLMDLIAAEMNIDPVEVRRRNFIAPEAFPYQTPTGPLYDTGEYDKALTKALEIVEYAALRDEQRGQRANLSRADRILGIGVACYVEMCAFGPYESAIVRVEPTGTVTAFTGISPHGQGQETTFAQIIAEQLGVDFDQIVVKHGDTAAMPMGQGTGGSRGLAVGGAAMVRATAKVRAKAERIAAHILEAAPDDVVFAEGYYQVKGVPAKRLMLSEIAEYAYSDDLPEDVDPGLEATDFFRPPELLYPFGAHVAVVEIERDTGIVHIRKYAAVDDCGPRISPMLVEGQVHGGLAQGISQALFEEIIYDDNGQLLTGSLMDYVVPHADQLPHFITDQTVTPTPHNPLGAKGIGEAPTIGSTPAIVNAVMDALAPFGVRHIDVPLKPEKIWRAMNRNV